MQNNQKNKLNHPICWENWKLRKKNSVQEAMCHAETGIIYTPIEMISILIMGGGVQIVCNQVLSICLELELLLSVHYNCPILHWISNEIEGPWTEVFWFSLKIKLYWIYECTTWAMI